jgi:O-antigen/teichoic acid export membrane protein
MIKEQISGVRDKSKAIVMTAGRDVFELLRMLKQRKFEGNKGIATKNSIFQILSNIIQKGGSLIFTLIFARILMPEMFGLYSLALSTILIFAGFSDLGISSTLILFISKSLEKGRKIEAKSYLVYLSKIKVFLLLAASALLLIFSKVIAQNYYHKPIYLALVAGALYIICVNAISIFESLFQATNNFKQGFLREAVFQILRVVIVPLITLYSIRNNSTEVTLFLVIGSISITYLFALLFMASSSFKQIEIMKLKGKKLTFEQRKKVSKFLLLLSSTILSGMFLGYVDTVILGRFVLAQYIGFYQAALTLVGSLSPLIPISIVLFPIFSRLNGERLERGFRKSTKITLLLSIGLFALTLIFAPLVIKIIYGVSYSPSINLLRILGITILFIPISALYDSYFVSQGKPQITAKLLIISTMINIVLNYAFITYLLHYSEYLAAIGSAVAVVITRAIYLWMQAIQKKSIMSKK